MKTPKTAAQRQQTFLLVLPLLVLPFLTMAFWALGGGQAADTSDDGKTTGLNLQLPAPRLGAEHRLSKLRLYQESKRAASPVTPQGQASLEENVPVSLLPLQSTPAPLTSVETQEAKVNERLKQITQLVHQPSGPSGQKPDLAKNTSTHLVDHARFSQDVSRLETLMQGLKQPQDGQTPDPKLQQLQGMLDRILDIQHPERVKSKALAQLAQAPVYSLEMQPTQGHLTLLQSGTQAQASSEPLQGFWGLRDDQGTEPDAAAGNSLAAAIHETQTVVSGGVVQLRLLESVVLAGRSLPKGSLVYGTCHLSGERLSIKVNTVQAQQTVLPVRLSAFDLDGLEGLFVPGSLSNEAAKQGTNRLLSQPLLPSLSPSLGAQAAGAGIATAQNLLSRKTRQNKVTLKAGHQLLLREDRLQKVSP